MSQRFFVESPIGEGAIARLTEAEAQHLVKVMRAKPGDEVTLFDGSGWEFVGRVSAIGKAAVELAIVERREVDRELPHAVTLAVSLPKGDRQKVLVEKLVELGVTRLSPLDTQRRVAEATPTALIRLRRQVIEASKQCGRNRLMQISEPISFGQLLAEASTSQRRVLAHPSGKPWKESTAAPALVAIGPEGGFTDDEVAAAQAAGWEIASLGPRILRIETAAIALAALLAKQCQ